MTETTQQGWRGTGGGGGGGLTNLTIQNTLYVMKNGDDATGLPNRLDKPFLTIYGATQSATIGDAIYVFAGIYNEGTNDIFASDVYYVLEDGVEVVCELKVVSDFGVQKNINITGNGILRTTVDFESVVFMTNSNSVLNLTCNKIIGQGCAIQGTGEMNINANYVTSVNSYAIYIDDTWGVGDKTFGIFNIKKLSLLLYLNNNSPLIIGQCNTDLVERNIIFNFGEIECNTERTGGAIYIFSNNNSKIYLEITQMKQINLGDYLAYCYDSNLFIQNSNLISNGGGIGVDDISNITIQNCNIVSRVGAMRIFSGSSITQVENSYLESKDYQAIDMQGTPALIIRNCILLVSGTGTKVISLTENCLLRIGNCQLIGDASVTNSISATLPANIYVYGQCSANKPTDINITNQVAGTNIVVDTDLVFNSNKFF